MEFTELGLRKELQEALARENITKPTEIQEKSIPFALKGKDVIGVSRTGSGKTLSFGLPILEHIDTKGNVQALILAPTRELAVQISRELHKFGRFIQVKIATVYGGVAIGPQIDEIARSQIVVGTPGRILDHLERRTLSLSTIKTFVLDEADKMVDMGFIDDVKRIISATPKGRQVLLFGATISDEIENIKRNFMNSPETVKTSVQVQEELLEQFYYDCQSKDKFSLLVHFIKKEEPTAGGMIIFCSTRQTVDLVADNLKFNKVKCDKIHGKLTQNKRQRIIDLFNEDKIKIIVASSVAARGLHIEGVTHVFNYDLPNDPQEYIHRIGRTARAGATGKAISILSPRDHDAFASILRRYQVPVHKLERVEFERVVFNVHPQGDGHSDRGNFRGQRGAPRQGRSFHGGPSRHERSEGHDRPVTRTTSRPKVYQPGTSSWREKEW